MSADLVSIIVPIYNKGEYLEECLNSIKNQSYTNIEVIMVDDGSTDNSGKIADEFDQSDNRFKVIHTPNGGSCVARNTGIDACTEGGGYIAFVDADDILDCNYISVLLDALKLTKADIAVCDFTPLEKSGMVPASIFEGEDILSAYMANLPGRRHRITNYIFNKLYTRAVISDIRFPIGVGNIRRDPMEDGIFTPKVLFNAKKVVQISSALYHYKTERSGMSLIGKSPEFVFGYHLNVLERYELLLEHLTNRSNIERVAGWLMRDSLNLIMSQWVEVSNILNLIKRIVINNDLKLAIVLQDKPSEKKLLRLLLSNASYQMIREELK